MRPATGLWRRVISVSEAKKVLDIEVEGLRAVRDRLGPEFEQAVNLIMASPTKLVVTGIGKSGLVGQKIAATLNSTGTPGRSVAASDPIRAARTSENQTVAVRLYF